MRNPVFHVITGGTPGLRRSAEVIAAEIGTQHPVNVHVSRDRFLHLPHTQLAIGLRNALGQNDHIAVFMENIPRGWLRVMSHSIFVPNQEWVRPETYRNMHRCSQIWCKTEYATQIFLNRGLNSRFIGFDSPDRYIPEVAKNFDNFLHIQGRSQLKGTNTVMRLWRSHPEWPLLTVVTRDLKLHELANHNIRIITDFMEETTLSKLMNSAGVHLCPSETEGFGHYLNEALSTSALVVTTDAPPMNELVRSEFGVLAKFSSTLQQDLSERFLVDATDLEDRINIIIHMNSEQKRSMGILARKSYLARQDTFKRSTAFAVRDFLGQ